MKKTKIKYDLSAPPTPPVYEMFRPIIEPALQELPPFSGKEPLESIAIESVHVDEPLTSESIQRIQKNITADERVQQLLGKRFHAIGVSYLESHDKRAQFELLFVFYNYLNNFVVEVLLDQEGKEIKSVTQSNYQPAPTNAEIEQVIKLARQDQRLSKLLKDDMEGSAILVIPRKNGDDGFSHRVFDVRFGYRDRRLSEYSALVDLSDEKVLRADSANQHVG